MTELINTPGGVVVEFTASWCGPCRLITPKYEALSNEYETVGFVEADIGKVGSIGKQIRSVPTFIFYSGDELVSTLSGANQGRLREEIEEIA